MMIGGAPVETSPAGGAASEEICRIILTSGTTGEPKAVALTHRWSMARNARFEYLLWKPGSDLLARFMHMGLAAALRLLFSDLYFGRGGTIFFLTAQH